MRLPPRPAARSRARSHGRTAAERTGNLGATRQLREVRLDRDDGCVLPSRQLWCRLVPAARDGSECLEGPPNFALAPRARAHTGHDQRLMMSATERRPTGLLESASTTSRVRGALLEHPRRGRRERIVRCRGHGIDSEIARLEPGVVLGAARDLREHGGSHDARWPRPGVGIDRHGRAHPCGPSSERDLESACRRDTSRAIGS